MNAFSSGNDSRLNGFSSSKIILKRSFNESDSNSRIVMLLKSYCEASEDGDWLDIDITHDLEEVEDLDYHNKSMAKLTFVKFNPSVNFKRN